MKTIGVVPARMAASRFPGKPLAPICGRSMLEHCYLRAKLYEGWDELVIATCDEEIKVFAEAKNFPVVMTSDTHTRALDRVAEAAENLSGTLDENDVVVCVQGDEPLLGPDMIEPVVRPFSDEDEVQGTILAVPITDEQTFMNPDTVKLVHDLRGDVLYTSRSPIPYCKKFSLELEAKRIGGILGFRWNFLKWFTENEESRLELLESCDSNRICDNGFRQRAVAAPDRLFLSVDSPEDLTKVEAVIENDPLWGSY